MESTNNELIEKCKLKDSKAQETIFKSYYSDFMKICIRYASDKQSANEILNDSFFKIFTKIDDYSGIGSFEGWMRKIVINTCLLHIRSNKNYNKNLVRQQDGDVTIFSKSHLDNEAISKLSMHELSQLIQSLPKMSRAVFNLNVFEGFTHKEIAKTMSISEGTSHWHLNYAREYLKSRIKKSNNDK
ncbi:MAG: RNA polymerase sigma factor [Bacteroidota bacterium]